MDRREAVGEVSIKDLPPRYWGRWRGFIAWLLDMLERLWSTPAEHRDYRRPACAICKGTGRVRFSYWPTFELGLPEAECPMCEGEGNEPGYVWMWPPYRYGIPWTYFGGEWYHMRHDLELYEETEQYMMGGHHDADMRTIEELYFVQFIDFAKSLHDYGAKLPPAPSLPPGYDPKSAYDPDKEVRITKAGMIQWLLGGISWTGPRRSSDRSLSPADQRRKSVLRHNE